jgi:hypothetical protein
MGLSLIGAMVSSVTYLVRWTTHTSFCSFKIAPTRRTMASSLAKPAKGSGRGEACCNGRRREDAGHIGAPLDFAVGSVDGVG